jgi:hypothetical protein
MEEAVVIVAEPKKRGRKKKKQNMYWGPEQEAAIIEFNISDIDRQHVLFTDTIQPAFKKLIENIYHTYSFNKTLHDFYFIQQEMIIFLYEKLPQFDATKGSKSFSYFGTIVKNWLIQQSTRAKKVVHIDDDHKEVIMYNISIKYHEQEKNKSGNMEFISELSEKLKEENMYKEVITDEDKRVIDIIIFILENLDRFDIYNKKQLYVYIREATGLPARKITKTIAKAKLLYKDVKQEHYL